MPKSSKFSEQELVGVNIGIDGERLCKRLVVGIVCNLRLVGRGRERVLETDEVDLR